MILSEFSETTSEIINVKPIEKLKKNHLQGKRLKELKRKWKEKSMEL
jgi:hypothetical protein